ncbi:unknown [Salmonella phage FelixO1]|uniref:Uncharacterized protein n=1 Tax=Salmonella phage Felix O1 (isolate Felix O1-VT1) TaxID=1283336 RepID=Q6KGN2_BPFO1|nr:unknown [Salmonella phage FelixO1]
MRVALCLLCWVNSNCCCIRCYRATCTSNYTGVASCISSSCAFFGVSCSSCIEDVFLPFLPLVTCRTCCSHFQVNASTLIDSLTRRLLCNHRQCINSNCCRI